jgi:hypothetical protein
MSNTFLLSKAQLFDICFVNILNKPMAYICFVIVEPVDVGSVRDSLGRVSSYSGRAMTEPKYTIGRSQDVTVIAITLRLTCRINMYSDSSEH